MHLFTMRKWNRHSFFKPKKSRRRLQSKYHLLKLGIFYVKHTLLFTFLEHRKFKKKIKQLHKNHVKILQITKTNLF